MIFFGLEPIFANVSFKRGASVATGLVIKTIIAMTTSLLYLGWRERIPRTTNSPAIGVRVFAGLSNPAFSLVYYEALAVLEGWPYDAETCRHTP